MSSVSLISDISLMEIVWARSFLLVANDQAKRCLSLAALQSA